HGPGRRPVRDRVVAGRVGAALAAGRVAPGLDHRRPAAVPPPALAAAARRRVPRHGPDPAAPGDELTDRAPRSGPGGKNATAGALAAYMTTIGLIGSGHIGSTVARLAVEAGHDVVLSNSRGPETLTELVDELGPHARAATPAEAAAAGELVVVTIPLKAYRQVPVEPLRRKVVIDTNNYYPKRDGHIAELDDGSTTSSELLQAHLPESHVVKAFNNIYFGHLGTLQRPAGSPE